MSNESITITQSINSVSIAAVGSVGLNAGGLIQGNLEVDGNVIIDGLLTVGADTDGKDVRFWGETASKYTLWDASQDKLIITGDLQVDGTTTTINSTVVTIEDPVFTLGGATAPTTSDSKDRGIEFHYYDTDASAGKKGFFGWGNSDNAIKFLLNCADPSGSEIFTGDLAEVHTGKLVAVPPVNTPAIGSTGYSLTGSDATSLIDLAGTWNTTGTPTAIKLNVTDTASNAGSLLMDLQASGSSKFKIWKDGGIVAPYVTGTAAATFELNNGQCKLNSTGSFAWGSTHAQSALDLKLYRDAAGILAQRNSGAAQEFRIYSDLGDPGGNYERGSFAMDTSGNLTIATEKGGTGSTGSITVDPENGNFFVEGTIVPKDNLISSWDSGDDLTIQVGSDTIFKSWESGVGWTETMRIENYTNGGRVGIGTASPLVKLHAVVSDTTKWQAAIEQDSTGDAALKFSVTARDWLIGIDNSDADKFKISYDANDLNDLTALTVDTAGRVGIGASSLTKEFEVYGATNARQILRAGNGYSELYFADDEALSGWLSYGHSDNSLIFATNSAERMAILATGNVGIGTSAPTSLLHLKGSASPILHVESTGDGKGVLALDGDRAGADNAVGQIRFQWNNNRVAEIACLSGADTTNKDEGELGFFTAPAGGTIAERVRIDLDGNVGIGTASPLAKIHCESTTLPQARIAYDASNYMLLQSTSAGTISAMTKDSAVVFTGTKSGSQLQVGQNFSKTILGEAGPVGIGTASPAKTLDVNSGATNGVAQFVSTDEGANIRFVDSVGSSVIGTEGASMIIGVDDAAAVASSNLKLQVDGSSKLLIDSSGNVGIGTSSPSYKLSVEGGGAHERIEIKSTGTGGTAGIFFISNNATGTTMRDDRANSLFEFINGTNYAFDGNVVQTPSASVTPANNGELVVEATSNTSITFKLKGSDGTVRTGSLTLS